MLKFNLKFIQIRVNTSTLEAYLRRMDLGITFSGGWVGGGPHVKPLQIS